MSVSNQIYPNGMLNILGSKGIHIGNLDIVDDLTVPTSTTTSSLVASSNYCKVVDSGETIASGTYTQLTFTSAVLDSANFFDISNPTYVTIPSDGIYEITGLVCFNYTVNSSIGMTLRVGTGIIDTQEYWALGTENNNATTPTIQATTLISLDAGDQISIWANQISGSPAIIQSANLIVKKVVSIISE